MCNYIFYTYFRDCNFEFCMSKRYNIFSEKFTIFFPKARKTVSVLEFEFEIFKMILVWRLYICNIYTITDF